MAGKYGHESYPSHCPQCRLDPARIMFWAGHRAAMVLPSFQTPTEAVRGANVTPRYTGTVTSVWFVVQRIETVEVERRPDRLDAVEPATNLGILEESRRNHVRGSDQLRPVLSLIGPVRCRTGSVAARHRQSP
jgi:hypothetical protein